MNTCHGAACWRARAYLKLREDGHTDTTYANDVLSADMTRPELVEALEQLPLPSSTCLLVIDRGVARYLVDALPPDFSSETISWFARSNTRFEGTGHLIWIKLKNRQFGSPNR
jgi:hypothetical protein